MNFVEEMQSYFDVKWQIIHIVASVLGRVNDEFMSTARCG